ncbi:MAG TPA: hypothetical protein VJL56_05865 [Candidatus Bathyarchaeia archaeon]|nr:hypothetical protein [Candidatus Bathyarchaeia archaeon]
MTLPALGETFADSYPAGESGTSRNEPGNATSADHLHDDKDD